MPPLTAKKIVKNREKEGTSGKRDEKSGKYREKEEKSERKGKNWEGSFTLPLLTNRAGFATVCDQGGFLGTQDLFFAHFTTFACTFLTVIFSNCLTIGYASFDAKKFRSTPSFSC